MKKLFILVCFSFLFLVGFDGVENLEVTKVKTTIIEENNELRYDFEITNHGDKPIKSEFDYPGNKHLGIELVVQPNKELAKYVVMESNTTHPKMLSIGSGSRGYFEANSESYFHVSYLIREDADFEQVKKHALHSNLLILDGVEIVTKFPLKNMK